MDVRRLWDSFCDVPAWRTWNPCILVSRVREGALAVGAHLDWVFNAIRPWYPYKLPATARIVELDPQRVVTWEVRLGGLHALHSYRFEAVDEGHCRFGSWEIGEGPGYRLLRRFWLAHFRYVCRTSLAGARVLAGRLNPGIRLQASGEGCGLPPLLVIPGIDGSPGSVAPIVERLARRRRVILADYENEQNNTLEDLAAQVSSTAAGALDGPVDLLGQSIGSIIAAEVAAAGALEVRRVVLVSTFTRVRSEALRIANALSRVTPRSLYRLTAEPLMAYVCGPVGDGANRAFLPAVREADPVYTARRTAWQIGRDFGAELAAVRQPVRVLMGADDRFVPAIDAELETLRSIFGAERVVAIPGAGHVLMPSAAIDTAVREIEAFLA